MIQWLVRVRVRREPVGFALITVILAVLVMGVLAVVIVQNVVSDLNGSNRQIQVTDSVSAADAGLTDLVYALGQTTSGTPNWSSFPTSYSTSSGTWYGWNAAGSGQYRAHVDTCSILTATRQVSSGCATTSTDLVATVQGQYPANTGTIRTVQAVLRNQADGPPAFNYAMFADKGIQVHHHNDSYISPTIVTSSIHSNGFITLNYPAIYRVGTMEAVGKVTIADGGGSTPAGNVTSSYNWPYWISGSDPNNPARCYPALQYPSLSYPTGGVQNPYWDVPSGSGTSSTCSGDPTWSPNAVVVGNIVANSVEVTQHGDTQQPTGASYHGVQWSPEATGTSTCNGTVQNGFTDPITGTCIPDDNADIDAGSVKFDVNGQTFTGPSGNPTETDYTNSAAACTALGGQVPCSPTCTACDQTTSDIAGHIGGAVKLHESTYAPTTVAFPSRDYRTYDYPTALTDQGGSASTCVNNYACHIFPTPGGQDILTWMKSASNVYYPGAGVHYSASVNPCPNTYCMTWLDANENYTNTPSQVEYVVLRGTYFITGTTKLALAENTLRSNFGTPSTASTPTLMVAGALVDEGGDIDLTASLTVVGPTMDPFNPMEADSDLSAGYETVPGLLASGGKINSTDYNTDSPYTSTSNYQGLYRNTVIVRGLVYSGTWSSTTNSSTATDQHFHNADPKNAQIILGAQIGGTLHDCSNFTFSYDPLIENLVGFGGSSGGGIYVVDWIQT